MKPELVLYNKYDENKGPVVYWMSRDQRYFSNKALHFAAEKSKELKQPFLVAFCLDDKYPAANIRHFDFMLKGLKELNNELWNRNIPFVLLNGTPDKVLPDFIHSIKAGVLITDFDPLRIKKRWKENVAKKLKIAFYEVDAHNIVPCRYVSQKQEWGAYTLRPKINRNLHSFLSETTEVPKFLPENMFWKTAPDFDALQKQINFDLSVSALTIVPGEKQALKQLNHFIKYKLNRYNSERNNPLSEVNSGLSPYLHFGQISSTEIAKKVIQSDAEPESKSAFLEELIVRKELSENFCFYNENYDNLLSLPEWSRRELDLHSNDTRDYLYSIDIFENAKTHDVLWNAAQREMVKSGKMHGYMRMYWAKKILEWTESPEYAVKTAIYLNDKYSLDGRDPNGYAGILWAIGGLHDRPWASRNVFGKIRYMNQTGCRKKFNIEKYILNWI